MVVQTAARAVRNQTRLLSAGSTEAMACSRAQERFTEKDRMAETGLRVLIVDDDAFLLDSLSQVLTGYGCKVRSADGAFSALSEIRREMPEVLLCDLNMPGFSGFELLIAVRNRFPQIHVIAMSGAFFGEAIPPGVLADAFYDKGRGVNALIDIVAATRRTPTGRADPGS